MTAAPFRFGRVSPPGRGAIGIIQLRGDGAPTTVGAIFRPKNPDGPATRPRYGRFHDPRDDRLLDDGVVIPVPGVGEAAFWLTLHGNPLLLEEVEAVLARLGGVEDSSSPLAPATRVGAEAHGLLPHAPSAEAAHFLLQQSEEGLARWAQDATGRRVSRPELEELLARGRWGRGFFEPRTVVLAGVPNAGKSTLFNALLGEDRVIEHPTPGTTRDVIRETALLGGFPVRLIDGAGVRTPRGTIEAEGIQRIGSAMAEADLVVWLEPPPFVPREDAPPPEALSRGRSLKIRSRSDQIAPEELAGGEPVSERRHEALLAVSARTGQGVRELEEAILCRLFGTAKPDVRLPAPFLRRHEEVLENALRLQSDPEACRDALALL